MNDFDYQQPDETIHLRIKLTIMTVLISVKEEDFNCLKEKIIATDGNLSVHIKKLYFYFKI